MVVFTIRVPIHLMYLIDVIYYYIMWTNKGSTLPEADTQRQEGKYSMIKVLQGCILKLSLHSVDSVFILYGIDNTQSTILLSFIASSSLPPCGLQSTHPPMPCYISPCVVYDIYDLSGLRVCLFCFLSVKFYGKFYQEWPIAYLAFLLTFLYYLKLG